MQAADRALAHSIESMLKTTNGVENDEHGRRIQLMTCRSLYITVVYIKLYRIYRLCSASR